ncbi:MAG TPA: hypothetical protein VGG72_18840 [Bryobacteraceae bacterium]
MYRRVRVLARDKDAHPVEGDRAARLAQPAARLEGSGRMIQITPQMRILVAVGVGEIPCSAAGEQALYGIDL